MPVVFFWMEENSDNQLALQVNVVFRKETTAYGWLINGNMDVTH